MKNSLPKLIHSISSVWYWYN